MSAIECSKGSGRCLVDDYPGSYPQSPQRSSHQQHQNSSHRRSRQFRIVAAYPVKGYSITVNLNDEQSQAGAPNVSLLDTKPSW